MPHNPQKIPAALGKTVGAPFDSLLPVEVGLVPKGVEIPPNPLHIVPRHIRAYVALRGVNYLALPRRETGHPAPRRDPAGILNIVTPEKKRADGQPKLADCARGQE